MTQNDIVVKDDDDLDLDAELADLDIDSDNFNLLSSWRSQKSSSKSEKRHPVDTSKHSDEEKVEEAVVVMVHDAQHWKTILERDEVFSSRYKPSSQEMREFQEFVTNLGLQRKGIFEKEDSKWKELSTRGNILLKRGPVICGGQERELVLLSHGFVLAQVKEAPKSALARILTSPKPALDQCDLFDAIEHIRSIPTTVTIIVEEEESEEGEELIEEGEGVVLEEQKEEEPAKEEPEEGEEMALEVPTEQVTKEEPKEVAAPQATKETPGTKKKKWFGKKQSQEEEKSVAKKEQKSKVKGKASETPPETNETAEEPKNGVEENEKGTTKGDEEPVIKQVQVTEDANKVDEEPGEEKEETHEGDKEPEVEQVKDTEDTIQAYQEPRVEQDDNKEDADQDVFDVAVGDEQDSLGGVEQDSPGGVEHKHEEDENCKEVVAAQDHTQKALAKEPIAVNEEANKDCMYCNAKLPAVAKFCFSCGEKQHKDEVAFQGDTEKEEDTPPERSEEQLGAKDDTDKDSMPPEQQQVVAEVKKKKKLVQRQEERYYFFIKTESNKYFLECNTAVELEAWLEAWERVLVQTRSRQRRNRERGWQHALVQTSLHSAAITGLDDLCSERWLDAKNDLDKYHSLSPLHYAVMVNHMHIMDFLLSHGANPEVQDAEERTPMYYAQRDGLGGAQHLLLEYGAQRSRLCDMEERGELFKGAAQVEAKKAAKEAREKRDESPNGELTAHHEKAVNARGAMADAMNQLKIRGQKINDLSEKTAALEEGTKTYGDLARQMKERAKKKKWYNIA